MTGGGGRGKLKKRFSNSVPIYWRFVEPLTGGIQGEWRPFLHFAMSQIDVEGSVRRHLSHSCFACCKVMCRTALRQHHSAP